MKVAETVRQVTAMSLAVTALTVAVSLGVAAHAWSAAAKTQMSLPEDYGFEAYQTWQRADDTVPDATCHTACENARLLPGDADNLWVVSALDGDGDDTHLGSVMVALVSREPQGFKVVATGRAAGALSVGGLNGENITTNIDGTAYHISAEEAAFGVVVHEGYSTESINTDHATLYLFLRHQQKLIPIFEAVVLSRSADLASSDGPSDPEDNYDATWIVRFSKCQTQGKFDLILQRLGQHSEKTYRWSGSRYRLSNSR